MSETESAIELFQGEITIEADGAPLMALRPLPPMARVTSVQPSGAMLAALETVGASSPVLATALREAAAAGNGLRVSFPPHIVKGLRDGSLHLMGSGSRTIPTAVDAGGKVVAQATVVGGGLAVGAATGVTLSAVAVVALPVVIAGAAAYAQQRQLDQSLASIKAVVERIEERLEDTDTGVCDAADEFLQLVQDAMEDGGLSDYLRVELAAQRTRVEALYGARRRWVERFKNTLEAEQVAREKSKGRGQPWVDSVADHAKNGKLEQELILFVRSLLSRSKLGVVAAAALAEDGRGSAALKLIDRYEIELRQEFFDLQRRLVPLAKYAPEGSLLQKLPGMGKTLLEAHSTVKTLVEHLNKHVLPGIPDPSEDRAVAADLSPETVASLAHRLS